MKINILTRNNTSITEMQSGNGIKNCNCNPSIFFIQVKKNKNQEKYILKSTLKQSFKYLHISKHGSELSLFINKISLCICDKIFFKEKGRKQFGYQL